MPSPRIAQRCAKFHRALVAWEGELFLTRFAAAGVVTECPQPSSVRHRRPGDDLAGQCASDQVEDIAQ